MREQYHILNGDSLKEQFPESILGEIIVTRECLVDGSVKGKNLTEFFKTRAEFISSKYDGYSEKDYFEKTVPEFQKMQNISDNSDINLWFEDDLFCQVNLWFVINLLNKTHSNSLFFLIRPESHNQHGFGGLNKSELTSIYENRMDLTELDKLSSLWDSYQTNETNKLIDTSRQLKSSYPFIFDAVEAHIERIPIDGKLGRPSRCLLQIMKELETDEFGPVFNEFNRRESIYGFGDLQVKRIIDELKNNR